jgi:hypothetical protein
MSEVGIYKLYKLGRLNGSKFDTGIKVLERDLHVIHHNYAENINAHSDLNGLFYELDEKATKLYKEKKPFKNVKEFTDFEEVNDDFDALKAEYLQLTGTKVHHLVKKEKLVEMIEAIKNKNE